MSAHIGTSGQTFFLLVEERRFQSREISSKPVSMPHFVGINM